MFWQKIFLFGQKYFLKFWLQYTIDIYQKDR